MALFRRRDRDADQNVGRDVGRDVGQDEFAAYYAARGPALRRAAYLMCQDWHLAEDLTQTTFVKLYQVWDRVGRREAIDRYSRRVLYRAFVDERRRPWRREQSTAPDDAALDRLADQPPAEDPRVREALLAVPKRQRAALVFRYWLDLPVEEVAEILGCSVGTVKSQTARGLDRLRDLLDPGAGRPKSGRGRHSGVRQR
jgi:RNA polymerase sigma-70 factor (sigma-E family)